MYNHKWGWTCQNRFYITAVAGILTSTLLLVWLSSSLHCVCIPLSLQLNSSFSSHLFCLSIFWIVLKPFLHLLFIKLNRLISLGWWCFQVQAPSQWDGDGTWSSTQSGHSEVHLLCLEPNLHPMRWTLFNLLQSSLCCQRMSAWLTPAHKIPVCAQFEIPAINWFGFGHGFLK